MKYSVGWAISTKERGDIHISASKTIYFQWGNKPKCVSGTLCIDYRSWQINAL